MDETTKHCALCGIPAKKGRILISCREALVCPECVNNATQALFDSHPRLVRNLRLDSLPTLHSAEGIAARLKHITASRLLELAESGHMPCYRIDDRVPRFALNEVRSYVARHLTQVQRGMPLPARLPVIEQVLDRAAIAPPALAAMAPFLRSYAQPDLPTAVYFLIDGEQVVYVGQSVGLASRIATHAREKRFDRVVYLPVAESELTAVEGAFIRLLKPRLNGTGKAGWDRTDAAVLARYGVNAGSEAA